MKFKTILLAINLLIFGINTNAQEQKEINLKPFKNVMFEGSASWILIPSIEDKVIIESNSKDVFDYIKIDETSDLLTISTTDKNKNITKLFKSVTINVYFNSIESISLSGVGTVKTKGQISTSELTATLKGTGNMFLDAVCDDFTGNMFGTGILSINGTSDKSVVKVEGVGTFDAYEFICADMNITVSGVGGAKVFANNVLTATLNGIGSIRFKGNPEIKNFNTNGIGSIKKWDN